MRRVMRLYELGEARLSRKPVYVRTRNLHRAAIATVERVIAPPEGSGIEPSVTIRLFGRMFDWDSDPPQYMLSLLPGLETTMPIWRIEAIKEG